MNMKQMGLLDRLDQYDAAELAALEAALQRECGQAQPNPQTIRELTDAAFALSGSEAPQPQMKADCIAAMREEQRKPRRHIRLHRAAAAACAGLILVLSANVFTLSRYRVNAFTAVMSLFRSHGQEWRITSDYPDVFHRAEDWAPTLTVPDGYPVPMQPADIPDGMRLTGYGWSERDASDKIVHDFGVHFKDAENESARQIDLQYSFLREPSDVPAEIPRLVGIQECPEIPDDAETDTVIFRGTETDVYYWKTNRWKPGGFLYAARFYYDGVVYSINASGLAEGELQAIVESFV